MTRHINWRQWWTLVFLCQLTCCIYGGNITSICGSCAETSSNVSTSESANQMSLCLETRMLAASLPGVLTDLRQSTHVYILYDQQASHLADTLVTIVSNLGFRLSLTSLHQNEAVFSCCTSEMPEFDSVFILVSSFSYSLPVLTEARARNLLGPLYLWLVLTYEYNPSQLHHSDVIMDGDRVSFLSLNIDTNNNTTSTLEECQSTLGNGGVDVYRFCNSTITSIGAWDVLTGWDLTRPVFSAFSGFNGKLFKVATLPVDYISFRFEFNGTVVYKGFFIELMEEMAKLLDFRIQIVEPPSGTWAEIIMMVVYRQVDFAIGPFTITAERKEYVDFMYPVLTEQLSFIMYVPSENPLASSTLVFEAMTYPVWIILYCTIILCATTLWALVILAAMPPKTGLARKKLDIVTVEQKKQCWVNASGTLLRNTTSVRVFDIFCRAAILVMVAAYMGNLTAFLTVQKTELPVNTLEELVNQDVYKAGILGDSAHQDLFEQATSGILHQVWKKIQEDPDNNLLPDIGSGLEKASDPESKFIYITEKTLSDIALRVDCNLGIGKEVLFPRSIAFPIQKGSPYTQLFNEIIMNMHEGGLIWRWRSSYMPENTCDLASTQTSATSLPLIALLGAFEIALLGNLIASLVFGLEKVVYKYRKNKVSPAIIKVQPKASS